jgi:chorismate synthase
LVLDKIRVDMDRRKPGFNGVLATTRRENDEFEIHSGIVDNKTNGEVIWISIPNTNTKPNDYSTILRPGHAD